MARLNAKDIGIAYSAATFASVTTGGVVGYLWQHLGGDVDYTLVVGSTWLLTVGAPSLFVSATLVKEKLGYKAPAQVTINRTSRQDFAGRKIPVSGGSRHVYLSELVPLSFGKQAKTAPQVEQVETFTVDQTTITIDEVESFVRAAWRRQQDGRYGLSRRWHTKQRRPRLNDALYEAIVNLLVAHGIVVDRAERRAGRLLYPPATVMHSLLT